MEGKFRKRANTVCKNCGREIMQGVRQGEGYWYHCIDFGDCDPKPIW